MLQESTPRLSFVFKVSIFISLSVTFDTTNYPPFGNLFAFGLSPTLLSLGISWTTLSLNLDLLFRRVLNGLQGQEPYPRENWDICRPFLLSVSATGLYWEGGWEGEKQEC